ncbi:MAG: FAD:protein FMN transferase [Akkermansiaceae bacterium]
MNRRNLLKLVAGAVLLPSRVGAESLTIGRPLMGTYFEIKTFTDNPQAFKKAETEAFALAEKINSVASDYIADSEILSFSKLPHCKPHPVSEILFSLLLEAKELAIRTHGNFDPTLGPLTKLWRESRRRKKLPDQEKLKRALAASGHDHLLLDPKERTLTFAVSGMRLDLGGIAKGQTADAMLAVFKKHNLPQTSITCGGDVRVGDPPPSKTHWLIGIKNSEKREAKPLELVNSAVSTSGDLHQFIEIDGKRYSHIIDPKTGLGLTEAKSATVTAPTAAESDALATAKCVAG